MGVGEDEEVEGPHRVLPVEAVPLEGADADLESIHPSAIVLQFLVAVLNPVVLMLAVLKPNVQP